MELCNRKILEWGRPTPTQLIFCKTAGQQVPLSLTLAYCSHCLENLRVIMDGVTGIPATSQGRANVFQAGVGSWKKLFYS